MIERTEQEIMKNWKSDIETPIVSICTITYNHEKFITEALDSFLMQETEFPFEIVIDDDCSIDDTANIIRAYMKKYPNIIKANLRSNNVGSTINYMENMQRARGKYLALCEGDDYWTDPLKLQKQVSFLRENLEYSMCCTVSTNYDHTKEVGICQFPNQIEDRDYTLYDLFKGNITNTCTVVYRNIGIVFPEIFKSFKFGDWPAHLLYAEQGKVRCLTDNTAVYRVHGEGLWTKNQETTKIQHSIDMLLGMNIYFKQKYQEEIYMTVASLMLMKAFKQFKQKGLSAFLSSYRESRRFKIISFRQTISIYMACCSGKLIKKTVEMKKRISKGLDNFSGTKVC